MLTVHIVHEGSAAASATVELPPRGQTFSRDPATGLRSAYLWWDAERMEQQHPGTYAVLLDALPGDKAWLGRPEGTDPIGAGMRAIVEETGTDGKVLSLRMTELPPVQAQQVPGGQHGGARVSTLAQAGQGLSAVGGL